MKERQDPCDLGLFALGVFCGLFLGALRLGCFVGFFLSGRW
jgi:hypothetical protein